MGRGRAQFDEEDFDDDFSSDSDTAKPAKSASNKKGTFLVAFSLQNPSLTKDPGQLLQISF